MSVLLIIQLFLYCCQFCWYNFFFHCCQFCWYNFFFHCCPFAHTTFSSLLPAAMACSSDITLHHLTLTANLLHHPHQGQSIKKKTHKVQWTRIPSFTPLLSHDVSDNRYEIISGVGEASERPCGMLTYIMAFSWACTRYHIRNWTRWTLGQKGNTFKSWATA